jgi:hypothetical protein
LLEGKGVPLYGETENIIQINGTLKPPRTEMSKDMRQEDADRRMVEAKRETEMTLDMKALFTLSEKPREEIRKETEDEQD